MLEGHHDNRLVILIPGLDGATAFFNDVVPELVSQPIRSEGCHHSDNFTHVHENNKYNRNVQVLVFHLPLLDANMKEKDYTFEYIASSLRRVIDSLPLPLRHHKVDIVGESFGGVVAQYFATMYPDRVNSLCLLSSLAKTVLPPSVEWKLNYLLPIVKSVGSVAPALAQNLFARLHVDDVVEPGEDQFVRDLFIKEASVAHFASVMRRIAIVSQLDQEARARQIAVPTLIIYGKDDHFTRPSSERLRELIPDSRIQALQGGHLPHVSSPKEFVSMIRSVCGRNQGGWHSGMH